MSTKQFILPLAGELVVDLFAGGGGWSTAFEMATGQHPHIAINHDADAISMHVANHPQTKHYQADIFEVCPHEAVGDMPVGWMHLSPDCTHHSQAKGGQPRDRKIRALSWVGIRWAGQVRPRIISLENVRQVLNWGPLVAKRCKETGRVVRLDGSVAAKGEHTPLSEQFLVPCKRRAGETWSRFVSVLSGMGYDVEWKRLVAADFGAPTTRDRLFMLARCDGAPLEWPEPTHFKTPTQKQPKWRAASECIDWSIPGRSIFNRPRPLADATLRRVARGVQRYVIDSGDPFIVPIANWSNDAVHAINEPLTTVTAWPRGGQHAVVSPVLVQTGYGERQGQAPRSLDIQSPLGTVVAGGSKHALATAYLAQMNGGFNTTPGHDVRNPTSTITNTGSQQQLVTAYLAHLRGNCDARDVNDSLQTISAGGLHHGLVECELSSDDESGALQVAAFLINYYGTGDARTLDAPMDTVTTRDRLALVTVHIRGTPYVIVDIKLRMLEPHELYAAQGFPPNYIITHGHDGRKFSKSAQVRMCGNSVSPPPAMALIQANWCATQQARKVA
ncbi:DNA cytosine methyltransferase [Paenalcaligenes niemegkensis]|uniref:DNA cytosine methyltransferase n=1 Tax=Paenalcaligenes niemegkensis TaxID=2895469 RepID=UPI001EE98BAF|nr:DNA cytosine methyltransferase [Paenalcaligenes niemegkensis]MCQ9618341.1 DNA cytosine methyltransferase [Paenalcaligenes niemegkensis]